MAALPLCENANEDAEAPAATPVDTKEINFRRSIISPEPLFPVN
jgi:hypothetical protein